MTQPKLAPKPVVESAGAQRADGVSFDAAHAARALEFVNTANREHLLRAGVYPRGANIIVDSRSFASLAEFGATAYIAEKSVQAVADATRRALRGFGAPRRLAAPA